MLGRDPGCGLKGH